MRRAITLLTAGSCTGALLIALAPTASASASASGMQSYVSPGDYVFTVPAGLTSITVSAVGAAGQSTHDGEEGVTAPGGAPGEAQGTFQVTPGKRFYIHVPATSGVAYGTHGTGGGAAYIRTSTSTTFTGNPATDPRIVVAGGGGGAAVQWDFGYGSGGYAGTTGAAGATGYAIEDYLDPGRGASGATQTSGGAGGASCHGQAPGGSGTAGFGGKTGMPGSSFGGGGGGDGWFGGGAGGQADQTMWYFCGAAGGGGGGSNYISSSATNRSSSHISTLGPRVLIKWS